MPRNDTLERIRINLLKAQDEVSKTFDGPADGLSMVEAYYLVENARSTVRRLTKNLDYIDKLLNQD
jgi:hypothetical protein